MAEVTPPVEAVRVGTRRAGAWLARRVHETIAFALPERCPGCEAEVAPGKFLCEACRARVPKLAIGLCTRCLTRGREPVGCAAHPGFTVWPAWIYDERAAAMIHALKFGERPGLATTLAVELARVVPPGRFDLVLAVPLHAERRRERGYDQAGRLADALARAIGVPRLDGAIERVRATRPQARLGAADRRRNLDAAFRVSLAPWLAGRRVLLIDDVVTTGATLEACLGVLREAGATAEAAALAWAQ